MDLAVSNCNSSTTTSTGIAKQVFQTKPSRRDGLVLQVHHTVPEPNGEIRRIRFVNITFDDSGQLLAAVDHRGNIFIIDLKSNKFWMLPSLGLPCTVLGFSPHRPNELLIGNTSCTLQFMNTELGQVTGELTGHTFPPTQISFSSDHRYCLSASAEEGIIWDLSTNSQAHRLSMSSGVAVKRVVFMPVSNNILACFQDDRMHVWKFGTFECLKQIIPEAWKSHHLKSIAFTKDGRGMVIGGHTPLLVVFALDNWTVKKVIELPDGIKGLKLIHFVPQMFDGGANKVLGILPTGSCSLRFMDIETSCLLPNVIETQCSIIKFLCSGNGKHIATILHSGEVNIYSTATVFNSSKSVSPFVGRVNSNNSSTTMGLEQKESTKFLLKRKPHSSQQHLKLVQNQIKETLHLERIKPILKEFGEYPAAYRILIWQTLLQTPGNEQPFVSLVNRDCHPSYLLLEKSYPLENRTVLKNLKRLLSCLANWSQIFGQVKYLPLFVFPFVKVFQNDPLICFEAVATIIVNWCQHWFEYFPHPPINVLAMVENVLAAHDPELLEHFYEKGVTSQLYAWPLLENAFSEVLSQSEWLKLWDHILSNEPAFLIMAVVAYNTTSRAALKGCHRICDFEYFYHNQNSVDMKGLIAKSYMLCRQTKEDIHPRQYLKDFAPMEKGIYPIFNQFPKFVEENNLEQVDKIRIEEEALLKEKEVALKAKQVQESRLHGEYLADVEEERLQKLEKAYRDTVKKAEERVARQRQNVQALRQDLRSNELAFLESAKERLLRKNTKKRSDALNQLLEDLNQKQSNEEAEIAVTQNEVRQHFSELLIHKHELEKQLEMPINDVIPVTSIEHHALKHQQEQLTIELQKLHSDAKLNHQSRHVGIIARIAKVEEMMQKVDMELAKEMAERQINLKTGYDNLKTMQLEVKTKELEVEVERLLDQLTEVRRIETKSKLEVLAHSQADRWKMNRGMENLVQSYKNDGQSNLNHSKNTCVNNPISTVEETNICQEKRSCQMPWSESAFAPINQIKLNYSLNTGNNAMPSDYAPRSSSVSSDSVQSSQHYGSEQDVVKCTMNLRERLLENAYAMSDWRQNSPTQ